MTTRTELAVSVEHERDHSNMLEKSLRILQAFRSGDESLRLGELAERTGMPKSTVHRLCAHLVDFQMLVANANGYELGIALFELSGLVPVKRRLRESALPFMQDLFLATHETVHLGVRDGHDVVYVEKIYGHSDLALPSRVGGRLPLNCTAVGKALLAFSCDELRQEVFRRPLRRLTDNSIIDRDRLNREIAEIRATGLAFESGESSPGRDCVAAPVIVRGIAVAAISLSVPHGAYRVPQLAAAVKTSALGLTRHLQPVAP